MSGIASTGTVATQTTAIIAVASTAPTLAAGVSSSAGFFSMINQFQMYLLLPIIAY